MKFFLTEKNGVAREEIILRYIVPTHNYERSPDGPVLLSQRTRFTRFLPHVCKQHATMGGCYALHVRVAKSFITRLVSSITRVRVRV